MFDSSGDSGPPCGVPSVLSLQDLQQRLLDQAIQYRRDAQRTYSAIRLRYFHFANRVWHVIARQ